MSDSEPFDLCPETFLETAGKLADAARGVAQRYFRQPFTVDDKADQSPVTIADREAESAMRRLIAEHCPDHGIVGEEEAATRPDAEFVWVLDPIDGTRAFVTGNPLFGTLIALLYQGRPILGLIDMPILDERWLGAAGHRTRFIDRNGSGEIAARTSGGLSEAILSTTSPEMFAGADAEAFQRVRNAVKRAQYGGDCYGYGLLASGFTDLVIEAGMAPYDYMALVPVVENAGGVITDWQGKPLGLDSDGKVLAAGDLACHAAAVELLSNAR